MYLLTKFISGYSISRALLQGPAGQAFAAALAANKTLKALNLTGSRIGEKGGVAIGAALAVNDTLESLR